MSNLGMFGTGNWLGILSTTLLIFSIYFTFTFFEHLKSGEHRLRERSKIAALICIAGALLIPAFYHFYIYNEMMK
ncbi:hypothetical protein [Planococcus versutus]|uniref:Uncharacterized protein n=1 Tax=Planococcus versutus TaxID=1302659 RepID=A0A1B1S545_9BACL|nr:hypothetical protein [Planococcus versutus]ANU28312.1 hypothetical protein I858_015075 [Planococcus versutus]